jgi:site-specific DNA-methyltransferase (adenine-specific)
MELDKVICGKMEEVLKDFPDNFFHSIVTDPPYGLKFMGKKWDYSVPSVEQWKEAYRVLKSGGYMLVACGTRTQHRMVVNIEDAGFEIRDVISWIYGSGFPKSLDISKAIDKASGAEREVGELKFKGGTQLGGMNDDNWEPKDVYDSFPATEKAKEWEGWGTALKPATEFWTLCRKPLSENTVAENVLKHGTGGINIDACRIEGSEGDDPRLGGNGSWKTDKAARNVYEGGYKGEQITSSNNGRFPSNLILDDFMAAELDKQSGILTSGAMKKSYEYQNNGFSMGKPTGSTNHLCESSSGGASRFFYVAKPSQYERNKGLKGKQKRFMDESRIEGSTGGSNPRNRGAETQRENFHPTVKPIELMRYLVRMITPKGGICLDPFCGSGTTLIACKMEEMNYMGIDMEQDFCDISEARIKAWHLQKDLFNE